MKSVVVFLRETGIRLIIYLDVLLIFNNLLNQPEFIEDLFQMFGLIVNNKKNQCRRKAMFLGLAISVTTMEVIPPKQQIVWVNELYFLLFAKQL